MTGRTGRYILATALVLAIGVPTVASGFGEGRYLKLGKRNPSTNSSLATTSETEMISDSPSYGTRQSNKRDGDGGGEHLLPAVRHEIHTTPVVRILQV